MGGRGLDPSGLAQVKQRGCLVHLVRLPRSFCSPALCGCACITVLFQAMSEILNGISELLLISVPFYAFLSSLGKQVLDDSKWADMLQQLTQCTAVPRGSQDTRSPHSSLSQMLQDLDIGLQHQMFLLQIHSY